MFLLPTMEEAKNWYPYDIGDMSDYLCHTSDVSFEFLEPAGKGFQAWEASNISTSKFVLQNWRTHDWGQLILGAQKHDKAENRLKHKWFFSAQK